MPNQLKSFFIVPSLQNAEFSDTNSQGGVSFGNGSAGSSNVGSLSVLGTGTPGSDPKTLTLRVQDSGSLNDTSFIYKESDQADSEYKGEHDRRYTHLHSTPFPYEYLDDPNTYGYGLTLGYCALNKTEFVAVSDQQNLNNVRLAYRQIDTTDIYHKETAGWNTTRLNLRTLFGRGIDFSGGSALSKSQIATCSLQNGKSLIFVKYDGDIDVYQTENVTTWTLICEKLLSRFVDIETRSTITLDGLDAASSGNFCKLIFTNFVGAVNQICCLTSSDNGLTWSLSDTNVAICGTSTASGFDRYSYSICGIGQNGGFLLANVDNVVNTIDVYYSTGNSQFSKKSNLGVTFPSWQMQGPCISLCKGTDSIFLFVDGIYVITDFISPPAEQSRNITTVFTTAKPDKSRMSMDQNIYQFSLSENLDLATWQDLGKYPFELISVSESTGTETPFRPISQTTSFQGARKFRYRRMRMIKTGASVALCASLRDCNITGGVGHVGGLIYMRIGGLDYRPVKDVYDDFRQGSEGHPINAYQQTYILFQVEWSAQIGVPAGILYANNDDQTAWKESRFYGNATRYWYVDRLKIQANLTTSQQLYYEFRDNRAWNTTVNDGYATPIRNWMFPTGNTQYQPIKNGLSASQIYKWSSGCVLEWCVTVSNNLTEPAGTNKEGQCAILIEGYRSWNASPSSSSQNISAAVEIRMFRDSVLMFDHGSNTVVKTLNITTTGRNLGNTYFEFRLAFLPVSPTSNSTQCILQCRPLGTSSWLSTTNRILSTSTAPLISAFYTQRIRFGMLQATSGNFSLGISSEWKYVRLHPCNDLEIYGLNGLLTDKSTPNILRGYKITNNLIYLQDNQSVLWSGSSGAEGDLYTLAPRYANASSNILHFDNPRQQWRSAGQTTSLQTTFQNAEINGKIKKDFISAIGIIGTNAKTLEFASKVNSSSSFVTQATISFERTRGRVTTTVTEGQTIEIEFDNNKVPYPGEYQSGESAGERKYYGRFGLLGGGSANISNDDHHLVLDHFQGTANNRQNIQLSDLATNSTIGAGTTLIIYGDRGYACFSGIKDNFSYRIKANGSANEIEGYLYCGTVCVGNTLQILPELNWGHTVSVQANNTDFNTRSGIEWSYNEGPSSRTLSGTLLGDVTQQMRNRLKNTIRRATDFNSRSLYFVLQDGVQDTDMIYYGRVQVGTNDNAGYYYDEEAQQWRSVGDMTLTIIENT